MIGHIDELTEYLIENYYARYYGPRIDVVPTAEQIRQAYFNHQDKFLIIRDEKIKGVAVFLTLTDESYALLETYDITSVEVLKGLLNQTGPHVHFVLLCADGYKTIRYGILEIRYRVNPKTISWWNPDLNKLHKFTIRS